MTGESQCVSRSRCVYYQQPKMQHNGTLRKRCKRTLIKVQGLSQIPYDQREADLLKFSSMWTYQQKLTKPQLVEARINQAMENFKKGLKNNSKYHNSGRPTRYPMYPDNDLEAGPYDISYPDNGLQHIEKNHNRPYLLNNTTWNCLRAIILFGGMALNFPWKWNRKMHRVDRWGSFMYYVWKAYWYFAFVQSSGLLIYHIHCVYGLYSKDLPSYRDIFGYSIILSWFFCHLILKTCMFFYEDGMRKYINQLIEFNQDFVDKYLIYSDKEMDFSSANVIVKFAIPAAASQIPNSLFFFLAMPYQTYYLTSKLDPRPWYYLIPGVIQELTISMQTMLSYITLSWMQVAHTSTVDFWLREMHKDTESIYTLDTMRTPPVAIRTYRALQLLCSDFNSCMGDLCMPIWKICVAFGFIPCGYLWVRSMNKLFIEEFPGSLVYPSGAFNCFTMGFGCLQLAAEMYDIANSFMDSWSRTKHKNFRRLFLSFPTLNIKVGHYYFITASTTITFFQAMIGYIIDCLLTFP